MNSSLSFYKSTYFFTSVSFSFIQTHACMLILHSIISLFLSRFLGDIQHEVLASAADEVLITLKDEAMKDFDKQKEIEAVLSAKVPSEVSLYFCL